MQCFLVKKCSFFVNTAQRNIRKTSICTLNTIALDTRERALFRSVLSEFPAAADASDSQKNNVQSVRCSQFVPVSDDAFTCWQTSCGGRQEKDREHDTLSYYQSQWRTLCPVECVYVCVIC